MFHNCNTVQIDCIDMSYMGNIVNSTILSTTTKQQTSSLPWLLIALEFDSPFIQGPPGPPGPPGRPVSWLITGVLPIFFFFNV